MKCQGCHCQESKCDENKEPLADKATDGLGIVVVLAFVVGLTAYYWFYDALKTLVK